MHCLLHGARVIPEAAPALYSSPLCVTAIGLQVHVIKQQVSLLKLCILAVNLTTLLWLLCTRMPCPLQPARD